MKIVLEFTPEVDLTGYAKRCAGLVEGDELTMKVKVTDVRYDPPFFELSLLPVGKLVTYPEGQGTYIQATLKKVEER